jgi:ubiquinone/menaquinone biosynthesis C-methylase UbiE
MSTDYEAIYRERAADYDLLVTAEDCDGALLPALESIAPLDGAAILEVGVGTGRLSRLLVPRARRFHGTERAPGMLDIARNHLDTIETRAAVTLELGDARSLEVGDAWADVAIAGWVFGHFRSWFASDWKVEIGRALAEMNRALAPDGTLVILETLGTGSTEPAPPQPELGEYYQWLEAEHGMTRLAIRTDYQFPDVETAARTTSFFFGEAFAARVRAEQWSRIPESTGLWWRKGKRAVD